MTGDLRRAVITGMGSVNPLGLSMEETWPRVVAGESGVGPITLFDAAAAGWKPASLAK